MRSRHEGSRFGRSLILVGILLLACVLSPSLAGASGDDPGAPGTGAAGAPSTGGAASRVQIDPLTGEIVPPPRGAVGTLGIDRLSPELREAVSTSHEGLVVSPGRSAAGGERLDLRGRFRSALIADLPAGGEPRTRCLANTPGTE